MPFYEYECSSCKFYSEVMQRITDPPLRKCPSCGKSTLKKLVSAPNFRLKGGGWYETDFKSDKEAKRNLAQGEKAEAADKSEAKEAKPAEAPETKPKPAEGKAGEPKAAAPESPERKSSTLSRKTTAPRRAAKAKSTRASARTKVRPTRKARR
jgi:putative FmdB family regulatory protein